MQLGYARVSTDDQHLHLQHDALQQAGCEQVFADHGSGATADRSGFQRLLESKEIGLKSLHESIDTTSSAGKRMFHIFGALAECERMLIRERTQAGLQAARARGRKGGRPKALSPDQQALAIKLYEEKQHTVAQICRMLGISKPTLYNYLADASAAGTTTT